MDSNTLRNGAQLRRKGNGFVAEGPGFYLWDEDAAGVRSFASSLEHSHSTVPQRREPVAAIRMRPTCSVLQGDAILHLEKAR